MSGLPNLLSWVTFLPLGTALFLMLGSLAATVAGARLPAQVWRGLGLGVSLLTFVLSLGLWLGHDPTNVEFQFVEYVPWIPQLGLHYFVGIDGIGLLLILLTTFLVPLVLIASWKEATPSPRAWVFFMLSLETGMIGTFAALNLLQFYLFWELVLVPMAFLIGIWGGPRRIHAALKFFLFTLLGSLLMLVGLLVVVHLHEVQFGHMNFDLVAGPGSKGTGLLQTVIPLAGAPWWQTQAWLFAAFALAFAIKVPIVPLHSWLPDAHVEAPTAGSVLLAAVLLKMGGYGFLRFAFPLFPVAATELAPLFLALALVGILYGSLVAMVQRDVKKLVAYTSVAHLGFVMLGLFAFNVEGLEGGILQMVNHGLSTGALFLMVGMLYERRHTRRIDEFGGIAKPMPVFAALFGVVVMSSIGLPALNGFVGEFLILLGLFQVHPAVAVPATFGVVLAAITMLWMMRRVLFGPVENPENRGLIDLGRREKAVVVALLVPIFWIGLHPETFLKRLHASVFELQRVMEERTAQSLATLPEAVGQGSSPAGRDLARASGEERH